MERDEGSLVHLSERTERRGPVVSRRAHPGSAFTQRLLLELQRHAVPWAPSPLGLDGDGWERVAWVEGTDLATSPLDPGVAAVRLAPMVRSLHDLTRSLAGTAECVVHGDLQPRNVVVRPGGGLSLIDWEQAHPGARIEDVANLCWSFVEPRPDAAVHDIAQSWGQVLDAYGPVDRDLLVPAVLARLERCVQDIDDGVERGSERHLRMAARGDRAALDGFRGRVETNSPELTQLLGAPPP